MIIYDENDNEISLPTRTIVCPRCGGRGAQVNPAVDGNGLSQDDMDELGEDFREDYFRGVYDIVCIECGGRNVVEEVDEDRLDPATKKIYEEYMQAEYEYNAMVEGERRMGA